MYLCLPLSCETTDMGIDMKSRNIVGGNDTDMITVWMSHGLTLQP